MMLDHLSSELGSGASPLDLFLEPVCRVAFASMAQGIMLVDGHGRVPLLNRQAISLLDLPYERVRDAPDYREILDIQWKSGEYGPNGEHVAPELRRMIKTAMSGRDLFGNLALYERARPNGTFLEVRTTPLPDGGLVRTYTDITERKRSEALIEFMARHDSLTGLTNRSHFLARLSEYLASGEGLCSLLLLDLDEFKAVNDTRGHQAGDLVLEEVARRIRSVSSASDTVARLGGDEFAIIHLNNFRISGSAFAERLIEAVGRPIRIGREQVEVGVSIGIAVAPSDAQNPQDLLRCADLALYRAKNSGRDGYCHFDRDVDVGWNLYVSRHERRIPLTSTDLQASAR